MENDKKTAVYVRTATKKQNHEVQLEAAKPFTKGIQEENLILIEDLGVASSSKLKGLEKLRELISKDKVDTLIVYSRDRLSRDDEDYVALVNLIYANDIKVVFTSKGSAPFNPDQISGILHEYLFLAMKNVERKQMSLRIKQGLKRVKD